MVTVAAHFIVFGVVFGIFDAIWLKSTSGIYKKYLGHLMRDKPNFVAAAIFYIIYVLGITVLAFAPLIVENISIWQTILTAGFVAFLCYATYDLTNLATVKGWPTKIVVIDIMWGIIATATATLLTVYGVGMFTGQI